MAYSSSSSSSSSGDGRDSSSLSTTLQQVNISAQADRLTKVIAKLARRTSKERNELELREEAKVYASTEQLMRSINAHLDVKLSAILKQAEEDKKLKFVNSEEVSSAKCCQKQRYLQVTIIPTTFIARDLEVSPTQQALLESVTQALSFDWGAKHVSLKVGDFCFEWGQESLIKPSHIPSSDAPPTEHRVHITDQVPHNIEAHRQTPDESSPLMSLKEESEILSVGITKVREQYENLCNLVVRYNTKYKYSPISRNCQKFVSDALKCLGIDMRPNIARDDQRFISLSEKKHPEIPSDFQSHKELDDFIRGRSRVFFQCLDSDSIEYLKICFSRFHGSLDCYIPSCTLSLFDTFLSQRQTDELQIV